MEKGKLFIIGIGPGDTSLLSDYAIRVIKKCDVLCGYKLYISRIYSIIDKKRSEIYRFDMGEEVKRVNFAIKEYKLGKDVALVCGGDPSLYGLASLGYELIDNVKDIEVIPGITAFLAASAKLGAAVSEDIVILSMSDLLIPWDIIKERIEAYSRIDVVLSVYNPKSKKRDWQLSFLVERLLENRGDVYCGAVKNAFNRNENIKLFKLSDIDYSYIDMRTVLIIGNSKTYVKDDKLVTPRGYNI